ncbi:MAG: hypothetical protein ACRDO8_08745, partial [Nocardioidaceae bacterium]
MAQALDRWRPPPVLPRVVVSILATAVVSGLVTAALVTRDTRADDFRAAALASALTALSSFVGAVVIAALTRR